MVDWLEAKDLLTNVDRFPEFCTKYIKIRPKGGGGLIPLKLNKIQLYIFNKHIAPVYKTGKPVRIVLLKARQFGGSTMVEAFIYWLTLGHSDWSSLVVGTEKEQAETLFRMLKAMNNNMPWAQTSPDLSVFPYFMQCGDRINAIEFNQKSRIHETKMVQEFKRLRLDSADMITLNSIIETKSAEIGDKLGRAGTYQAVHASEVAKWKGVARPMSALISCCHPFPETFLVLESTANGMNEFYQLWTNLKLDGDDVPSFWQKCFIPWYWDEAYELDVAVKKETIDDYEDELFGRILNDADYREHIVVPTEDRVWRKLFWRRHAIRDIKLGDIDLFNEDYPSTPAEAFISSGRSVFHKGQLREMAAKAVRPIWQGHVFAAENQQQDTVYDEHHRGSLRIWEEPIDLHRYVIFADIAQGKALEGDMSKELKSKYDYSCAHVLCATSFPPAMKQVAMWHGNCDPDKFGDVLVALARKYNNAYLGWEANFQGRGMGFHIVRKHGYSNVYMREDRDHIGHRRKKVHGWLTNPRTKHDMVVTAKKMIRDREIEIYDEGTITELHNYTQEGTAYGPAAGHDDRVDSLMGALIISDQMLTYWRREYELKKKDQAKLEGHVQKLDVFDNDEYQEEDTEFNPYLGDDF